jgi:hypothetical protein
VKQTRKARGGGNRQEGAKPWSRNVAGSGKPGVEWTPPLMALKGEKPQERHAANVARRRQHGLREKALKENGIAGEDDCRPKVGGGNGEEKPQGPAARPRTERERVTNVRATPTFPKKL